MIKSEFIIKYKDEYEGKLSDIANLKEEEITHCLAESIKNNTYLDIILKSDIDKIEFLGNKISLLDYVNKTSYYRVSLWIITEFIFLINISSNISYFKDLYKSASEIKKFSILDELKGFYGCENSYSIIAKDSLDRIIFLARFGNGKKEDLEIFMEETLLVKRNMIKNKKNELYSAFYISREKIDNIALSYYYNNVKKETGIFNKSKSYVKVSMTDGFNLILLEENSNSISLIAPNLFEK